MKDLDLILNLTLFSENDPCGVYGALRSVYEHLKSNALLSATTDDRIVRFHAAAIKNSDKIAKLSLEPHYTRDFELYGEAVAPLFEGEKRKVFEHNLAAAVSALDSEDTEAVKETLSTLLYDIAASWDLLKSSGTIFSFLRMITVVYPALHDTARDRVTLAGYIVDIFS